MEDNNLAVFKACNQQVMYKQILDEGTVIDLKKHLITCSYQGNYTNMALRSRLDSEALTNELLFQIESAIKITLGSYFTTVEVGNVRFYKQDFGATKPHTDICTDGKSNYTLLIYLSDDFEKGKLRLKCKRTENEIKHEHHNKKHMVFTFFPKIGYGVLFNKDIVHYAEEVYGRKEIMLVDMYIK